MTDCSVCCNKYNKSINAVVTCGTCDYQSCKKCVRTYLLGSANQAHCMNCKVMWNHKFLIDNLNRSFVDTEYKKSRSTIILDEHKSKLSEYMYLVEYESEKRKLEEQLKIESEKLKELKKLYYDQFYKVNELKSRAVKSKNSRPIIDENGMIKNICGESIEHKKFIMPCRADNCRGFLSTQYKCGLCDQYTCSKCYEIIGTLDKKEAHICKEENILSTEAIKKDSKACPGCGIPISKIIGCSQIYCVECRTVFDYNTLKIQYGGVIHNPHYYEMKKKENKTVPNVLEAVLCDGLINIHTLNQMFDMFYRNSRIRETNNKKSYEFYKDCLTKLNIKDEEPKRDRYGYIINSFVCYTFKDLFGNLHRFITELNDIYISRLNRKIQELDRDDKEKITLDYLLKKIDDNELGSKLKTMNTNKCKLIEKLHLYELVYTCAKDIINGVYNEATNNRNIEKKSIEECKKIMENSIIDGLYELNRVINYCNRQFAIQSFTYKTVVECIQNIYQIIKTNTRRYNVETKLNDMYIKNNSAVTKQELDKIMENDDIIVEDIINCRQDLIQKKIDKKKKLMIEKDKAKMINKNVEGSSSSGVTKYDLDTQIDSDDNED